MFSFQQGQDPYKTMEIGSNRPVQVDDKFKANETLIWVRDSIQTGYSPRYHWTPENFATTVEQMGASACIRNECLLVIYSINFSVGFAVGTGVDTSAGWISYKDLENYFTRL
jgi:hypothetical protein